MAYFSKGVPHESTKHTLRVAYLLKEQQRTNNRSETLLSAVPRARWLCTVWSSPGDDRVVFICISNPSDTPGAWTFCVPNASCSSSTRRSGEGAEWVGGKLTRPIRLRSRRATREPAAAHQWGENIYFPSSASSVECVVQPQKRNERYKTKAFVSFFEACLTHFENDDGVSLAEATDAEASASKSASAAQFCATTASVFCRSIRMDGWWWILRVYLWPTLWDFPLSGGWVSERF